MASHNITGRTGEEIAARFLEQHGYTLLDRNWISNRLEIDIVAEKEGQLIIVEVKTRKENPLASPLEAITDAKMRRMIAATDLYIKAFQIDKEVRFDLIAVVLSGETSRVTHIKDAFTSF